jgi:signal transduction histidine kinase
VAALRAAATTLTGDAGLELAFDVDGSVGFIPTELETDLLRVGQEAITNTIKHAIAHIVQVRLHDDGQYLALYIRDDGRGFDQEARRDRLDKGSLLHQRSAIRLAVVRVWEPIDRTFRI